MTTLLHVSTHAYALCHAYSGHYHGFGYWFRVCWPDTYAHEWSIVKGMMGVLNQAVNQGDTILKGMS